MNKLLTISVALLSLNLYGADNIDILMKLQKEIKELRAEVAGLNVKLTHQLNPLWATITSSGLEGWGKEGVQIIIRDYSKLYKPFNRKEISNIIELKRRLAGFKTKERFPLIRVAGSGPHNLRINCVPSVTNSDRLIGWNIDITPTRPMTFHYNDIQYTQLLSDVNRYGGGGPSLRQELNKFMDKFLIDYLKANPLIVLEPPAKKKEKE